MSDQNPLLDFIQRYGPAAGAYGVELMAKEVFGYTLDPWQRDVCRDYCSGERKISIAACHGPGKTFVVSLWVVNQMLCRFPQKCVATAPSRGQLENALMGEVISRFKELPPALRDLFEIKKNRIELIADPERSFFSASTARAESPEALQGVHSEHVLLIVDEGSAVPDPVYEAGQGSMSGHNATTVILSNPTRATGYFYQTQRGAARENWKRYTISAFDSSRVSDEYVKEIADAYGEDSNVYRVRVLGLFPKEDDDTIISLDLVESAQNRGIIVPENLRCVWGIDVARYGRDKCALVIRDSMSVRPEIEEWGKTSLMETAGKVYRKWQDTPAHKRPEWVYVDVNGMGGGVVDRLLELGLPVRAVNVAETDTLDKERYGDFRTDLWFRVREWLESKTVVLPACEGGCKTDCLHAKLAYELTTVRYKFDSKGRFKAESKDDMARRKVKSPNLADALIMTFADQQAALIYGGTDNWKSQSWNTPVNLGRPMV